MSDKVGKVFDGVISGITEWGVYVELNQNKCEGMIPVRELGDDYYTFDEKNYCLIGRRRHRKFQLGDPTSTRDRSCASCGRMPGSTFTRKTSCSCSSRTK